MTSPHEYNWLTVGESVMLAEAEAVMAARAYLGDDFANVNASALKAILLTFQ